MESTLQQRIELLGEAINKWLAPDNYVLKEAIDRTVRDGFFSFEDIRYQLLALKKSLTAGEFRRWITRAGLKQHKPSNETVLCLHAGNIPLVGIQDILAVALSGKRYLGKLSRKDPWLPATLLQVLQNHELIHGKWTTHIDELAGEQAYAVLFSGSTDTAAPVLDLLEKKNIISANTPRLVRTAHFSMAFIEDEKPENLRQLTNAVFRYGGSGCRSVAMVVAPFSFNHIKCHLTDYIEEFWLRNPQHKKPPPSLFYRFAYNRAVGIEQSWLDHFLVEETSHKPDEPFVLHWVDGDRQDFIDLAWKYREGLQSVYSMDPGFELPEELPKTEVLSEAQQPPIWWKPDGIDPLRWLEHCV